MRSGSALLLAGEGAEALEGLYGSRQAQRVHARDHRRRSRTKTMAWRRCRASRGAWLGGEEEGVAAELLSSAEGRGVAGDGCYGERRRRWCSAVRERERGRGRKEPGRVRESRGDRDGLRESSTRPGARRQAGGGRAAARARARSSFGARGGRRRRATVLGWVGCWLGRPAGWAAQVSFSSLFCFLFYLIILQLC